MSFQLNRQELEEKKKRRRKWKGGRNKNKVYRLLCNYEKGEEYIKALIDLGETEAISSKHIYQTRCRNILKNIKKAGETAEMLKIYTTDGASGEG